MAECPRLRGSRLLAIFPPGVGGKRFAEMTCNQATGKFMQRGGQNVRCTAALNNFALMHD